MYNYYSDIVWSVDVALFFIIIFLVITILSYLFIKQYSDARRRRSLLNIKKGVYELLLSGQKLDKNICMPFAAGSTPSRFIDVETNRIRDAVFFNASEQQLFRDCFINPENIKKLELTARSFGDKWKRIEAIMSLGYAETAAAVKTLKKLVFDKDEDIAYFSMIALGQIKTVESARALLEVVKRSVFSRYKAASVLEGFPPEATTDVIGLTGDKDPAVRAWALKIAARFKPEKDFEKIEKLTGDKFPDVRAAACECLGSTGRKEARGSLLKCLKDESWFVRMHAVRAISKIFKDKSLSDIIGLINDDSWSVISSVKIIMSEYIKESLPYIEEFLKGNSELARRVAVEVLGDSWYMAKLLKNILSGNDEERSLSVRLLKLAVKSEIPFGLEAALNDFDENSRDKILEKIRMP